MQYQKVRYLILNLALLVSTNAFAAGGGTLNSGTDTSPPQNIYYINIEIARCSCGLDRALSDGTKIYSCQSLAESYEIDDDIAYNNKNNPGANFQLYAVGLKNSQTSSGTQWYQPLVYRFKGWSDFGSNISHDDYLNKISYYKSKSDASLKGASEACNTAKEAGLGRETHYDRVRQLKNNLGKLVDDANFLLGAENTSGQKIQLYDILYWLKDSKGVGYDVKNGQNGSAAFIQ